jgi:hypothetical protein
MISMYWNHRFSNDWLPHHRLSLYPMYEAARKYHFVEATKMFLMEAMEFAVACVNLRIMKHGTAKYLTGFIINGCTGNALRFHETGFAKKGKLPAMRDLRRLKL